MDLVFHLALPAVLLLALRVRARYALGLAPLALLPDLDGLTTAGHRIYLHNLFVVAAAGLLAYAVLRWGLKQRPEARAAGIVAAFMVASHLILDLADPAGWLFPLTDRGFYASIGVVGDFRTEAHAYYPLLRLGSVAPEGAWSYPQVAHFESAHHVAYMVSPQAVQFLLLTAGAVALFGRAALARATREIRPRAVVRLRPARPPAPEPGALAKARVETRGER